MNWKAKALAHNIISYGPFIGQRLRYFLQRKITKSLPRDKDGFNRGIRVALRHIEACSKYCEIPIAESKFYEFGAGWDMLGPLVFYCTGVNRQTVIDIWPFFDFNLINTTIDFLANCNDTTFNRKPHNFLRAGSALKDFEKYYGICYRAPVDACDTNFPSESFDCITSTLTMEHIPEKNVADILVESKRLLKKVGIASFAIDYQDHYSYFDKSISAYNFLKYSERAWRLFNPPSHYQNRLRHRDYCDILTKTGFQILNVKQEEGSKEDIELLSAFPINERFSCYSINDLAVRAGDFVAKI